MKKLINLKNLINIRNLIIVILCLTIISLGIGFAFLSVELEKRSDKNLIIDVAIVDVIQNTLIKGGELSPNATQTITESKNTISTTMNLYAPYDELSYTIIIENKGTIKAEITDLIETPSYTKNTEAMTSIYPVEISHLDIVGKILEPGEQLELTIVASYKPTVTPQTKNINYQLSVIAKSYKEE